MLDGMGLRGDRGQPSRARRRHGNGSGAVDDAAVERTMPPRIEVCSVRAFAPEGLQRFIRAAGLAGSAVEGVENVMRRHPTVEGPRSAAARARSLRQSSRDHPRLRGRALPGCAKWSEPRSRRRTTRAGVTTERAPALPRSRDPTAPCRRDWNREWRGYRRRRGHVAAQTGERRNVIDGVRLDGPHQLDRLAESSEVFVDPMPECMHLRWLRFPNRHQGGPALRLRSSATAATNACAALSRGTSPCSGCAGSSAPQARASATASAVTRERRNGRR